MSKLDGNNRWGTKFIMQEHAAQYEQERREKSTDRLPTTKELTMIRDAIMLPHLMTIVQRGIERTSAPATVGELYKVAGKVLLDMVMRDLYELRRELKQRKIRFWTEEQDDNAIHHRYVCRGYEGRFPIVREVLRSEISIRLGRYCKAFEQRLTESEKKKPPAG